MGCRRPLCAVVPRERVEDNAVERPLYLLWPRQHVDAVVCRPVVQHRYGDVGVVLQGIHELLPTKRMHLIDDIRLEALPVALGGTGGGGDSSTGGAMSK